MCMQMIGLDDKLQLDDEYISVEEATDERRQRKGGAEEEGTEGEGQRRGAEGGGRGRGQREGAEGGGRGRGQRERGRGRGAEGEGQREGGRGRGAEGEGAEGEGAERDVQWGTPVLLLTNY